MKRILVIADDFTGAGEIGGVAKAHGFSARVACGHLPSEMDDAVIIDTDTRNLSAGDAAERIEKIARTIERNQFDLIYKKTDSVLRGPVATELSALRTTLGFARVLLAPQNPSRGRVIVDGEYLIDGVPLHRTEFANDPTHPATTADVRKLLRGGDDIEIADGSSIEDLRQAAGSLDVATLAAGGADFFAAILAQRGLQRREAPVVQISGPRLLISGTTTRGTFGGLDHAVCLMPGDGNHSAWADALCERLDSHGLAVAAVGHPIAAERAGEIDRMLIDAARAVLEARKPGTILVEGGATAASLIRKMRWEEFAVVGEVESGVIALRPAALNREIILIVKPGSYRWPGGVFQ